jgi:hypothetical protein
MKEQTMTTPSIRMVPPLAVVPPPSPERKPERRPKTELDRTPLQVCLEHLVSDAEVAARVLSSRAFATYLNVGLHHFMLREQELEAEVRAA